MHKFYNKNEDKWEMVEPVKWKWEAHYTDGTILKQYDDDGTFHRLAEIEQDKLHLFKMVDGSREYQLIFNPQHMKLVHFYRNVVLNATQENEIRVRLFVYGYETKVKRTTHKVLNVIMPDGQLVTTEDINKIRLVGGHDGN
jgi:hypothetical protein